MRFHYTLLLTIFGMDTGTVPPIYRQSIHTAGMLQPVTQQYLFRKALL